MAMICISVFGYQLSTIELIFIIVILKVAFNIFRKETLNDILKYIQSGNGSGFCFLFAIFASHFKQFNSTGVPKIFVFTTNKKAEGLFAQQLFSLAIFLSFAEVMISVGKSMVALPKIRICQIPSRPRCRNSL